MNSVAMFPPAPDRPADMIWNGADEQVIICLDSLRHGSPLPNNVIEDINPHQYKPANLPGGLWYLLRSTEKKETAFGFWKEKEAACEIFTNSAISGWRTTLEFVEFQDAQEQRTNWVMQKYMITEKGLSCTKKEKESRAICRVFLSSGRSSNAEMHPNSREAAIVCRNHINSVESVVPSADGTSKQGFTKVSNGVDSKQLLSEANRTRIRDISDLHYISDGDFLEFDDLVDPQSRSTSSDNTTRSSFTMDEYFDSNALLQELEDKKNQGSQAKDSNSRFSVTASIKPLELVMQPATLGSLVCASGIQSPARCNLTSSILKMQNLDEGIPNHTVKRLKNEKRDDDSSQDKATSSNSSLPLSKGKEKAAGVKIKRLKKYFCFMPF